MSPVGLELPRVIGHRGAAGLAPENTLAGIRKAAELGCRMVELDVKLSACGRPILMHDDRLGRTTDGRGAVAKAGLETLRALDAGAWFGPAFGGERVPTLEEAVACALERRLALNLEIKPCEGRERLTGRLVADLLRRLWPADRSPPLLSSFDQVALVAAAEAAPELPRGLLLHSRLPLRWRRGLEHLGCASLNLNHRLLSRGRTGRIKRAGVPLLVYTVNDPVRAALLVGWGVDAVITDRPDLLLPVLGSA